MLNSHNSSLVTGNKPNVIDEKKCIGESNMSVLSQSACIVHVVCSSMHTKNCTKQSKRFEGNKTLFY